MAHTRPRILQGGFIAYPRKGVEPPPDIEGYVRDPQDSYRFIPKWFQCDFRIQSQYVKSCGNVTIKSFCSHQESPVGQGNEVELPVCQACTLCKTRGA